MGVRIRQKDGKWYVFINHQGTRKAKCVGSDKRLAVQVQKQLEAKLALGDVGLLQAEPKAVLFGDYAKQWLETYVSVVCKPSSGRIMRGIVSNHLIPAFGRQDLRSLTRSDVKAFVAEKQRGVSPQHVKNITRTLHTIFAAAVDEEIMDRNPADRLGKYLPEKRGDAERTLTSFTSTELSQYLTTMQKRYPQYYAYFLCLARTGMREGEALALHWDDCQFGRDAHDPHRFVHVQRTYDAAHHLFNTPKSGKSRRVDMSQDLRVVLLERRNQRFDAAVLAGRTTLDPLVFGTARRLPWDPKHITTVHGRVCALAGLRVNRVHDLRHSYATIMLYELQAPMQYVSEQLGHSSIKITVDIYGHPRQGTSIALADLLDRADVRTVETVETATYVQLQDL